MGRVEMERGGEVGREMGGDGEGMEGDNWREA